MNPTYQPEDLTPHARSVFEKLTSELPPSIASRLTCSRAVRRHGNARTVLLFNIWDRHQCGTFDPKYFSYCLGYDPKRVYCKGADWYLNFEVNKRRIYQYSAEITASLKSIVERQAPARLPAFWDPTSNWVGCGSPLPDFSGDLADFEQFFFPLYFELIESIHPYLLPIFDSFTYDLTREEREEVIRSRQHFYTGPKRRLSSDQIREYSRSIPASWRTRLVERAGNRCALCNTSLDPSSTHIDHIEPFSKGGLTVPDNLQAVCAPCNLKKGNRP
jgi:hypothetical protein